MNKKDLEIAKQKILDRIKNSDNFAILVSDPDEDAIGSGLAMEEILVQLGKQVKLFSSFEVDQYKYLPHNSRFIIKDITTIDYSDFKTLIVLDAGEIYRLYNQVKHPEQFVFPPDTFVINIDHHPDNPLFGSIDYVPSSIASSAGELLYDIFKDEIDITKTIATNLLAAIIGDTGCFRYSNTSPHTLNVASKLISYKAQHRMIINKVYYDHNFTIVKKTINVLQNIEIKTISKYTFAYVVLDNEKETVEQMRHEILRSIKEINFYIVLKRKGEKRTKISFRSKDTAISKIAELLGGGGHPESAGVIVDFPPDVALEKIEELLRTHKLKKFTY